MLPLCCQPSQPSFGTVPVQQNLQLLAAKTPGIWGDFVPLDEAGQQVLPPCYILYLPPLTNLVTGLPANRCLTVGNMKNNKLLFDFPAHKCSAENFVVIGNDLSSFNDADSVSSFIPHCCYLSPDYVFFFKVRGQVT